MSIQRGHADAAKGLKKRGSRGEINLLRKAQLVRGKTHKMRRAALSLRNS